MIFLENRHKQRTNMLLDEATTAVIQVFTDLHSEQTVYLRQSHNKHLYETECAAAVTQF